MKNKILSGAWVLAVAVVVCCSGCSRQLTGTVFIVTEGAQTFRLPLTTVEVVKAEEFRKYCKDMEAELAQLKASGLVKLKELNAKQAKESAAERNRGIQILLGERHMAQLTELGENYAASAWNHYIGPKANAKAPPVTTGKTDADGKFAIQVPGAGAYFVKAQASRRVGEKTENYQWIVPVTVSVGKDATVDLSNQNLATKEALAGLIDFEKLGI